jgi:hypothetical protein
MRSGVIKDTGDFALRDRLRFWFGTQERAQEEYAQLPVKGDIQIDEEACKNMCPYGIDIPYKLSLADYKLAGKESY